MSRQELLKAFRVAECNTVMGRIATLDKKSSVLISKDLVSKSLSSLPCSEGAKLGVRDGLLGVFRVGGGNQKITV